MRCGNEEKYCDLCEPGEFGATCHASEDDECPNGVYCDAEYDIHGNRLNEMAEDERRRYGW